VRGLRQAGAGLNARRVRQWSHRRLAFALAVCSAVVLSDTSVVSAQIRRPTSRPAAPQAARHPPFKAIFEPVGYARDADISDVFFVDAETGWVCGRQRTAAGDGGFIAGTRDGGRTWSLQLGDPRSPARAFERLFFFDASHGWAAQAGGTLLRTTDGSTWKPASTGPPMGPFVFVSPERGFLLDGGQDIQTTVDGGRTWRRVYHCRVTVEVSGVPHQQNCAPQALAFAPDRATGYVVTRALDGGGAAVIKTADAGETWTVASVIPDTIGTDASLAFADAFTGYLRAGPVLNTTLDGGQTWHAVTARIPEGALEVRAAGSVGWMVGSHGFSYTLDGGQRWIARQVDFPARVVAFTVLSADTGYVAGSHGMIYRYRVVPFDYVVPRMLAIPGMTTFVPGGS
jgi:photosystem II stability/assembly factor-like uncharacterized protein